MIKNMNQMDSDRLMMPPGPRRLPDPIIRDRLLVIELPPSVTGEMFYANLNLIMTGNDQWQLVASTGYALFIDDERDPPTSRDWTIARTSDEAINITSRRGIPGFISFDHDLGGEDTAMAFLRIFIPQLITQGVKTFPDYYIHSQNPVGKKNIEGAIESLQRYWQK